MRTFLTHNIKQTVCTKTEIYFKVPFLKQWLKRETVWHRPLLEFKRHCLCCGPLTSLSGEVYLHI